MQPQYEPLEERLTSLFMQKLERDIKYFRYSDESRGMLTSSVRAPEPLRIDSRIHLADCEATAERFAYTFSLCERFHTRGFPVLPTEDGPVPIILSSPDTTTPTVQLLQVRQRFAEITLQQVLFGRPVFFASFSDITNTFQHGLTSFLRTRLSYDIESPTFFGAIRPGTGNQGPPGRLFEVTTSTEGLTVYYSPAFVVQDDLVFGFPTNPVKEWLHPGNYYFGASGPGVAPFFDTDNKYEVPRLGRAHLHV